MIRLNSKIQIGIVCLGILLAGCIAPPTATNETARLEASVQVLDALTRYELAYSLQAGDLLEVAVYSHPAFSRKVTVRADGFISMPLLGDVRAAGKAPTQLARELTGLFSVRLRNPELTVIIENPPEPMVYVLGDVGVPKPVPFRQVKTVAQAIAQAGAVLRSADLKGVSVVRLNKQGFVEAHAVNSQGNSQPEIFMALQGMTVQPNDLVIVPESYRSQITRIFSDINTFMQPYYQFRILEQITK